LGTPTPTKPEVQFESPGWIIDYGIRRRRDLVSHIILPGLFAGNDINEPSCGHGTYCINIDT
jgi:hypothetical protein